MILSYLAGQVRMDLEPGRIGFMSTQRRENRWQRRSCTERAGAPGPVGPAVIARHACAQATVGTAPLAAALWLPVAWLATKSLQLDCRFLTIVRFRHQDTRRSSSPPGQKSCTAAGTPATLWSSPSHIPSPSGFARLHPALPQIPAGTSRWTERYDGKRDLYFQHAA